MRVAFDTFIFDSERRQLSRNGASVHLGPKAFRLLEILIERRPHPIRKHELYESIWNDTFVDESNLAGLVSELRTALGDRARKSRYIRTVHAFGYAFSGDALEDESKPPAFLVFQRRRLALRRGANVLGRDAAADIQIDDGTVSRRHAVISIHDEGATIDDLASKNGTFIDGARLESAVALREGQTIVLGDARIVFRTSASTGSTVSATRMRKSRA